MLIASRIKAAVERWIGNARRNGVRPNIIVVVKGKGYGIISSRFHACVEDGGWDGRSTNISESEISEIIVEHEKRSHVWYGCAELFADAVAAAPLPSFE